MAFMFKSIDQQMQNQQSGNNIFGQSNAPQQQGGPVQLSSSQQSSSGGGTQSAGQNQNVVKNAPQPASNAGLYNQISKKNTVNPENIGFVKEAQTSASNIKQNLQNEANQIGSRAANVQTVSDEDYDRGIKQGGEAFSNIEKVLSQKYTPVQDVSLTTDTKIKNLNELGDSAQRRALAQKEYGPQYNTGMASLDDALLKRSSQFQNILSNLKGEQSAIEADKLAKQASLTSAANAAQETGIKTEQDRIKKKLGETREVLSAKIRDQQEAAIQEAKNAQLEDESWLRDYAGSVRQKAAEIERQKAIDAIHKKYGIKSNIGDIYNEEDIPKIDSEINLIKNKPWQDFGPSDFRDRNLFDIRGQYGYHDSAATPEQAAQFNNILSLLGEQPTFTAAPSESRIKRIDKQKAENIGSSYLKNKYGI